jgi:hypothetical protein
MPGQDETPERTDATKEARQAAAIPDQASARDRDAVADEASIRGRHSVRDQAPPDHSPVRDQERMTPPSDAVPGHDGPVADHDARSLGQLVASASRDLSALVRGEISLAKAELAETARAASKGAGLFGAAGFLAYVAFLMLSIAAGYGLVAAGLHPAVSFVIVAGVYLLVAGIIAFVGLRSVRKAKAPERTLHSIEEAKGLVGRGNAGGGAGVEDHSAR